MKKRLYLGFNKATNNGVVSTTKQGLADYIGLNVRTLSRHLLISPIYMKDDWIILDNVVIIKKPGARKRNMNR
jgi:hypothetical protein